MALMLRTIYFTRASMQVCRRIIIKKTIQMMYTQEVIEILIVEDDPFHAELSISALQEKNVSNTIIHLKNGAEALNYLFHAETVAGNQCNENPKVMLLDLRMPLVDG